MTEDIHYSGEHMDDREPGDEQGRPHPHVRIFGEEIGRQEDVDDIHARRRARWEWHIERGRKHQGGSMVFGLLILFFGVVLFLNALGLLPQGFWHTIVPFLPALLILWGVSVILGGHWSSRIIVLLIALALLFVIIAFGIERPAPAVDNGAQGTANTPALQ